MATAAMRRCPACRAPFTKTAGCDHVSHSLDHSQVIGTLTTLISDDVWEVQSELLL